MLKKFLVVSTLVGAVAATGSSTPLRSAIARAIHPENGVAHAAATRSSEVPASPASSFSAIAAGASPAVVNIATKQSKNLTRGAMRGPFGPFVPPGATPEGGARRGLGTGFVVRADGLIVTNHHVVADAEELTVRMAGDDRDYEAKLIGSDPKTDLALIKIEAEHPLPTLALGDSSSMRVGDWVVAIGNPFGLEQTVTAGIVSATGRAIGQGPYDDFLQTDASINPGNSGGPLLNTYGEVIGINTAIFSRSGGNVGIGFAIPTDLARNVVSQIEDHGSVVRGWLGVSVQDLSSEIADSLGLTDRRGALVADIVSNGPAANAGLERGDIIRTFEGEPIQSSRDLPRLVAETPLDQKVHVGILRGDHERTLEIEIRQMPGDDTAVTPTAQATPGDFGLALAPLSPRAQKQLGVSTGVLVRGVRRGSRADEAGIRPGDVIQEVNRQRVDDPRRLLSALSTGEQRASALLLVRRAGGSLFVAMKQAADSRG